MASILEGMRLVHFPSSEVEEQAFSALMMIEKSVHVVNDAQYVITERQCTHLKEKGIDYKIDKIL